MTSTNIGRARALLEQARRVVVLTGAGISTDSGIADFRGPQGVWTKNPEAEKMATLQAYVSDPELRAGFVAEPSDLVHVVGRRPTPGTARWSTWSAAGGWTSLVTQNIDGLHQKAGTDPARIVEIHGTSLDVMCLRCGDRQPAEPVHDRVRAGEADPACTAMVVARRSDGVVAAGSSSRPPSASARASWPRTCSGPRRRRPTCDLLLAVGSTLAVFPAAGLVPVAVRHGAVAIIVNGEPDRHGRPGRRGAAGLHQRVPAGAGGGADPYSVEPRLASSDPRVGAWPCDGASAANHQMLAIVPSVTAAAATGLTTL